MALRYAFATLAILFIQSHTFAAQTPASQMLEIHVNTPTWLNGCLDLTIERVNVSSQTIYLSDWDSFSFSLSARQIHNDRKNEDRDVWLLFYGPNDRVDPDAREFPAGSRTTDHFCLPETFSVVNKQQKTRRQVEVRGRVKIAASYFPTEEEWKASRAEQEKHMPTPWRSPSASVEMIVPCLPQSECVMNCKTAVPIIEGESIVVPDVFRSYKDWNDRGNALSITLDLQHPPCKK
jgi:hypothetical protein